jgi:peroxiredoxin
MNRMRFAVPLVGVLVLAALTAVAAKPARKPELAIGAKAIGFSLVGVDDKTRALSDYEQKDVLVVVFTCNHCPYAKAYEDRLIALQNDYAKKGVQLIAINPNRSDYGGGAESMDAMKKRAKEKAFPFPYLKDETQEIAAAYGARVTPHVYLFGRNRTLLYRGTVDNNWRNPEKVTQSYLRDAIEAALKGYEPVTKAIGCSIKWK